MAEDTSIKLEPNEFDGNGFRKKEDSFRNSECLFCAAKWNSGGDERGGQGGLRFSLKGSEGSACVNEQLWAVFVLRQLLRFSEKKVSVLFRRSGGVSPAEWFCLCDTCQLEVNQAMKIYVEILRMTEKLKQLGNAMISKMLERELEEEEPEPASFPNFSDTTLIVRDISKEIIKALKETVTGVVKADLLDEDSFKNYYLEPTSFEEPDFNVLDDDDIFEEEDLTDPLYIPEGGDECLDTPEISNNLRSGGARRKQNFTRRTSSEKGSSNGSKFSKKLKTGKLDKIKKKHSIPESRRRAIFEEYDKHFQNGTYNCPMCPAKYKIRAVFQRHIRIHKRKGAYLSFKCDICNYAAASSASLCNHLFKEHQVSIQCDICLEWFSFQSALVEHRKLKHNLAVDSTEEKPEVVPCSDDDATATIETDFDVESEKKPKRQWTCGLCVYKRVFTNAKSFHNHKRWHTVYRNSACPKCNYPCKSFAALKVHLAKNFCQRKTEFSCQVCDFKAKRRYLLDAHLEKHKYEQEVNKEANAPGSALIVHAKDNQGDDACLNIPEFSNNLRSGGSQRKQNFTTRTSSEKESSDDGSTFSKKRKTDEKLDYTQKKYSIPECRRRAIFEEYDKHFQNGTYNCPMCPAKYHIRTVFQRHIRIHKRKGAYLSFKCDICNYAAASSASLRCHLFKQHKVSIQCDICLERFSFQSALEEHKKLKHNLAVDSTEEKPELPEVVPCSNDDVVESGKKPKPQWTCDLCVYKRVFTNACSFHNHKRWHTVYRDTACPKCNYPCKTSAALKAHLAKNFCQRKTEFSCQVCDFKATKRYLLDAHLEKHKFQQEVSKEAKTPVPVLTIHAKRKRENVMETKTLFTCELCSLQIFNSTNYFNHCETHKIYDNGIHEDGFWQCKLCQHKCKGRVRFGQHMRGNHREELDLQCFICPHCPKNYSKEYDLKNHIAEAHSKNCKYVCEKCGYGNNKPSIMEKHMASHSEEKTIACHLCPETFKTGSALNNHIRNVHGRKVNREEYKCSSCTVTLISRHLLKEHMKSAHKELYQYRCDECGKEYASVASLQLHQKAIHSGDGPAECQFCHAKLKSKTYFYSHFKYYCQKKPPGYKYTVPRTSNKK